MREVSGIKRYLISGLQYLVARSTEIGSRALVAGACAGLGSHGKYMSDCVNLEPAGWIQTEEGARLQRRVYEQTMDVLEKVEPDISKNFSF